MTKDGRDSALDLSRREALAVGGAGLVAGVGAGAALAGQAKPGGAVNRDVAVKVSQATNVAITAAPDGRTIAFDLLGILWTLPIEGGTPRRLTGEFDDLGQPDWSPDGRTIAVQSYRTGNFHIWTVPASGGAMRQLTTGASDNREPRWSPDGRTIAFASDRAEGRYAIHLLDVASGGVTILSSGKSQDSEPCWSPDGKRIAYIADGARVVVIDLAAKAVMVAADIGAAGDIFHPRQLRAPSYAPDGRLAWTRVDDDGVTLVIDGKDVVAGEDLYPFRPAWLAGGGFVYGADGHIRRRGPTGPATDIEFSVEVPVTRPDYRKKKRDFTSATPRPVVGIVAPKLSPDGGRIVFGALNDLWIMPIGQAPKPLVKDGWYKVDPVWSPDGRFIAYASDRGGTMDIWVRDLAAGTDRQLTNLPNQGAVSPDWSPDGKQIAFLDQEGALHIVDVASGTVRKLFAPLWEPGRPSFGPGGKTIAYAAFKPTSARYREGLSQILTVDVATGKGTYTPVAEGKSLGVRGLDGPVWSPDGTMFAYVFASTLWVQPVDAAGTFTGPARRITREVTDAPSWSGDSKSLLYLSGGVLKLVPVAGGAARAIPCRLTWANARTKGRTVVRAERIWDGEAAGYRAGAADVVIEGNRVVALAAPGSVADRNARIVDGAGLTLMPGLVDIHTHRQMQGYNYGDRMGRLWLAMGITATRSPGAPAYHMVEDREAIANGNRIAARHFATGEAIDGSRIYYNFMRPVTEPGQMALELERARALDYDMVKTYVRLRHDIQKQVVNAAHAMGMHLSSHYHYPALHSGMDGMEHMGATNRYGYSRTITSLGGGYGDVTGLFAAARAERTPTLFASTALLGEDAGLAQDERIRTLFPSWEYAKLMGRVKAMRGGNPAPMLASLERQVKQIKDTMAAGWHVVSGTDAPIDLVAISLHLNLRGMVRYGISPVDALRTATSYSGAFLDEPIGRIAPGMLADMILVRGDPLARIEDVAAVTATIADGAVHTPAELMRPFAAKQVSAVYNRVLPARPDRNGYYWQGHDYVESGRAACCADHAQAHMRSA